MPALPLPPKIRCAMSRAWSLLFGSMALGEALASRLGAFRFPIWPSVPWKAAGASPFSLLFASCSRNGFFCGSGGLTRSLVRTALLPESSSVNSSPEAARVIAATTRSPAKKNTRRKMLSAVQSSRSVSGTRTLGGTGWKQRSTTTPPMSTSAMSSGSRVMA